MTAGASAGCSSPGQTTTGPDTVGSTAAVEGIEITFVDYVTTSELAYVPRGDRVTVADDAPDRESVTVEPRESGREFLVLVVRVVNVADDTRVIPTSAPGGTAISDGRIYLEAGPANELRPVPVNPDAEFAVGGAYQYDGSWYDRFMLVVGSVGGNLDPGSSVAGWILYEVETDIDLGDLVLVALANPTGANRRLTWAFPDS